jgi:hypothetical protein
MEVIYPCCCGLDVHKKSITACVLWAEAKGKSRKEKKRFGTFTHDLLQLDDWLEQCVEHSRGAVRAKSRILQPPKKTSIHPRPETYRPLWLLRRLFLFEEAAEGVYGVGRILTFGCGTAADAAELRLE